MVMMWTYKSWSSTALPGKVRVIQHIAGRSAAKKIEAMIEAIKAAHFSKPNIKPRPLLMLMMLLWVQACCKSSAEKGKRKCP